jgi:hypothetical protein
MASHSQGKNKKVASKIQVKIQPSSQEWGSVLSRGIHLIAAPTTLHCIRVFLLIFFYLFGL